MNQPDLFSAATPRARRTDPAQSHRAAARAVRFSGTHRERILAALKLWGPKTAHELEPFTGLNYVQIDRRMHELVKAGQVRAAMHGGAPVLHSTPSGGHAQVWEAV